MSTDKRVSMFLVGCGNRGEVYSSYALARPDLARLVGLADPQRHVRNRFAKVFEATIDKAKIFDDWRKAAHINARGHGIRFMPPFNKHKNLIDSGLIGDIVNINHTEPVGYWHFAHSYVRGNWHKEADSSFSLLAKCCHDIDLLCYWMGEKKCAQVFSFGSLTHFRKENAPKNASTHCMTCPEEPNCCYSAKKIYLNKSKRFASVILSAELFKSTTKTSDDEQDIEDLYVNMSEERRGELVEQCLRSPDTNYGRCVYRMDNWSG